MWLHLCFETGLKDRASVESKEKTQPTHINWSRSQTAAERASHPEAEGWPPDKSWETRGAGQPVGPNSSARVSSLLCRVQGCATRPSEADAGPH